MMARIRLCTNIVLEAVLRVRGIFAVYCDVPSGDSKMKFKVETHIHEV
jgi:hypothetical protein